MSTILKRSYIMEKEYVVKKCGGSLYVIVNPKKYKIGDKVKLVSEEDKRTTGLLMGTVEDLKTRIKILEDGN